MDPGARRADPADKRPASTATGPRMSDEARTTFLARPLIARLATSDSSEPRVLPMWFYWDGERVWMETGADFPNARILRANSRAAITFDESEGGLKLRAVIMRGTVDVIDAPNEFITTTIRRIYVRYVGEDGLKDPKVVAMGRGRHVILRFTPTFETSWDATSAPARPR